MAVDFLVNNNLTNLIFNGCIKERDPLSETISLSNLRDLEKERERCT